MEIYLIIAVAGMMIMTIIGFLVGKKNGSYENGSEKLTALENKVIELNAKNSEQEMIINNYINEVRTLTTEREVQRTNAENLAKRWEDFRTETDKRNAEEKERHEKELNSLKANYEKQLSEAKTTYETILLNQKKEAKEALLRQGEQGEEILANVKNGLEKQLDEQKTNHEKQIEELKIAHEKQNRTLKESFEKQLEQVKEASERQLEALREMNKKQVEAQLTLIKEQMKSTSESVLKARQEELGERNKEQVSKIIDPLQKSIKDMQEAFDKNKEQQSEALTRLDATIKVNMEKSIALGETADRLTRALTGEVKVQGNFGELKLKQLLEDLELKEGEQFDSQETLRDQYGKAHKGDEGKGMIPDFILHFPNNRHVVVDAKMSLTDYERYMNSEDNEEKSLHLQAHLQSVRTQVKRLAKKEYTKFLPSGYNRLNFAIMYVPIEGALNLALFNDSTLWREAYDDGVMILGPQTMYMNLRVLEMMWTQVRQLNNQQAMIDAANTIVERVQDFGQRFLDVESSMNDAMKKMSRLKITTADGGPSIITAARNLIKAGAKENKKKKSIADLDDTVFIDTDQTRLLGNADDEIKSASEANVNESMFS